MTDDDLFNGRLIVVIGVAPVRPAEFVIFRIPQPPRKQRYIDSAMNQTRTSK